MQKRACSRLQLYQLRVLASLSWRGKKKKTKNTGIKRNLTTLHRVANSAFVVCEPGIVECWKVPLSKASVLMFAFVVLFLECSLT